MFLLVVAAFGLLARAHTVITYPGWRGNNLITNGTAPELDPDLIGVGYENGSWTYPYGMQWTYPCGGMPMSTNRTYWPTTGGAVSIQPGWFPGHSKAFFYINIGIQEEGQLAPVNYSHNAVPPFQITGAANNSEYAGQFCLPQVPMPADLPALKAGTNATIQVIELAQHGAAIYNCVDVVLADPGSEEITEVTPQNCYNSTDIGFDLVFTTEALASAATAPVAASSILLLLTAVAAAVIASVS